MIPKINTFTLYLCCGTCYHKSSRFWGDFEARFALFGSSIPNPEFPMVISNVPAADPGAGSGGSEPPIRPDTCLRLKFVHREYHYPCRDFAQKA